MSLLKNLGTKIGEAASDAADKAKEAAEIAKLKLDITGEEKKIQQAHIELGKIYYEANKSAEDIPGKEFFTIIEEAEAAIAEMEEKIKSIKE